MNQGDAVTLSQQNLKATDEETPADQLIITIAGIAHAKVVQTDNPAVSITSFGNKDLQDGKIRLVTDGGKLPPSINFTITDADGGIAGPIEAEINFNQRPDTVVNRLDVNPDQTIGITQANLKADDDDPDSIVTFVVKDIAHGYFSRVNDPGKTPITEFTQKDVIDNNIQFTSDGSGFPRYTIVAGDGRLQDDPDAAVITYGGSRGQIGAPKDHTVRNALIAASITTAVALLVFGLKMYLKRKVEKNFNKAILEADSESSQERAKYYKDVIQPIARAVFDEISIQRFLGFVSKKDMKRYINAIAYLVTQIKSRHVAGKPIKIDFRNTDQPLNTATDQTPDAAQGVELESLEPAVTTQGALDNLTQTDLISIIVRKTKVVLADQLRKGCSSYFKPQATPNQISENASAIADAVQAELEQLASHGMEDSTWHEMRRTSIVDWSNAGVSNPVFDTRLPGMAEAASSNQNHYSWSTLLSTVNALKQRVFGNNTTTQYQRLPDGSVVNGGSNNNFEGNNPNQYHGNDSPFAGNDGAPRVDADDNVIDLATADHAEPATLKT